MSTKSDADKKLAIDPQLIDELIAGHSTPQAIQDNISVLRIR